MLKDEHINVNSNSDLDLESHFITGGNELVFNAEDALNPLELEFDLPRAFVVHGFLGYWR